MKWLASLMGRGLDFGFGQLENLINDKRQVKMNQKLMDQQIAGSKDLGKFNQRLQFDMLESNRQWNSPAEQLARLKEAGLSPALMYGGSGAGGQLQGSAGQAGSASGGTPMMGKMGNISIAKEVAELKQMEAQTENLKVDAEVKKAGAVEKQEAEIESLRGDARLKQLQAGFDEIRNEIQTNTRFVQEEILNRELDNAIADYNLKLTEQEFVDLTLDDRVSMVYEEAVGVGIANELSRMNIQKSEAEIDKMAQDVAIAWKNSRLIERAQELSNKDLDRKERELIETKYANDVRAFEAQVKREFQPIWNVGGRGLDMFSRLGDRVWNDVAGYFSTKRGGYNDVRSDIVPRRQ